MALRNFLVPALMVFALASVACTGGRRGGSLPRDTGMIRVDGGDGSMPVDSGRDSTIVLMDTGTTPECSPSDPCPVGQTCVSGTCQTDTMPECTTSSDCPTGQICNASNRCVPDSTRVCEGSDVAYNRVAVCSASTDTCISGCADGACIQSCLDADPNPDCSPCVNQNLISCLNDAGCQPSWDVYVCCIEDNCGTMATSTCVTSARAGACATSYSTWDSCTMTADVETSCPGGVWLTDCF